MSDIVRDAENLLRVPKGAEAFSALDSPVNSALLWNIGSGAYTALPGPSLPIDAPPAPVLAKRPCVQRTAFGKAGRPGREDEQVRIGVGRGLPRTVEVGRAEQFGVSPGVGAEDALGSDVVWRVVKDVFVGLRRHEDLAVAVVDQARELVATVGRVDPDDRPNG